MTDVVGPESLQSKQMLQGWGVSLLLHIGVVFAAVTMMPKMTIVLEQEPFRWEVALVEPSQEALPQEVAPSVAQVQPPKPTPVHTVRPVEPPHESVMPHVATQESPQMIHPVIEQPKPEQPIEPIERVVHAETKPAEAQDATKEEVKEPVPITKEVVAAIEPTAPTYTYQAPVAAPSSPVVEPRSEPVTESAPSVAALEPAPTTPAPSSVAATPIEPIAAPSVSAARERSPVVASAVPQRPPTKANYAWLAESLGRRIAALMHYPSAARLNGWEGRVVLRAVIRADGHLADVTVQKSSGYDALDRAAVETVRLACPLHMKHQLSTTEVAVNVPIVYSLSN